MADDKSLEGIQIAFVSGGLPDEIIDLRGVWGRERLSRLFEFDVILSRRAGPFSDDELDELLKAPCALALGPRPGDVVHGLVERVELIDATRNVAARYLARIVPTVWTLTLARSNRIYQDTTIPKMVEDILKMYGLVKGKDFNILITGSAPEHEYVVQYEESDWDFIQRWLEHEGYFYWFEHGKDGEKLIIADENADTTPIDDPSAISYRERNNLSTGRIATVWSWNLLQRRIPARVAVFDYNYRTPNIPLVATADIDTQRGFGSVFFYGEHFKDKAAGKVIAKARAERIQTERRTFTGRTDCSRFRAGHHFELENHYEASFDARYLITSIEHRVGYPVRADEGDEGGPLAPVRYHAKFEAIPMDVQFRPERVTPWPRIHGILHGHIDADTAGDFAQIDSQGRYKVKLPFDVSGRKGTKSSRWIRMAQPYSGAGYGSHFPLHKGTEVLLAHIDGDPDRPIIVGSVPNPHTVSPSTTTNATQSVIHTASGIRMEMEDNQS
ncbi:MAG: type VI secretion system tip protein TssI/VgrG [Byssovorax sp.]